jgi:hypothetical protein
MPAIAHFATWFNNLYPVWLVGLATVAFVRPETMRWFDTPWIFGALATSMLGMGLSLNLADFRDVRRNGEVNQGRERISHPAGSRRLPPAPAGGLCIFTLCTAPRSTAAV